MMKKYYVEKINFVTLGVMLLCALSGVAQAQNYSSKPSKVLEYSLMSLKESAQEVQKANHKIQLDNHNMRQNIKEAKLEIEALNKKIMHVNPKTTTESLLSEDKTDYNQVKTMRIHQQLKQLASEELRLKEQLNQKLSQWKALENQVKQVEADIEGLKQKVTSAESAAQGTQSHQQWVILKDSREKGQLSLAETEKELVSVKKRYSAPLKELEKLKRKNLILKKRQKRLDVELEHNDREEAQLLQQLEEIEATYFGQTINLEEKISLLKSRSDELNDILVEARLKIEEKDINFEVSNKGDDIKQLRENLAVIKKENEVLYNEFSTLQERLKK